MRKEELIEQLSEQIEQIELLIAEYEFEAKDIEYPSLDTALQSVHKLLSVLNLLMCHRLDKLEKGWSKEESLRDSCHDACHWHVRINDDGKVFIRHH